MGKKRLDALVLEKGFAQSLQQAQALILAGQVRVYRTEARSRSETADLPLPAALPSLKSGSLVFENSKIEVDSLQRFVSRGGEKLKAALDYWNLSVKNKTCLDVGVSTGGFSDCLLQNGAARVYALDVGYGQIHPKLRSDPRVQLFERTHILKWNPPWGVRPEQGASRERSAVPSFIAIDLSFISLKTVLPRVVKLLEVDLEFKLEVLALVKPQFEVEQKLASRGIVKDEKVRSEAVEKIIAVARQIDLEVVGHFPCPVLGAKGNREEWLYLSKEQS